MITSFLILNYMEINVRKGDLWGEECDVLIVSEFQAAKQLDLTGDLEVLNDEMEGLIKEVADEEGFKGKLGEMFLVRSGGTISAKRVLVVGLGKEGEFDYEKVRMVSASAFNKIKGLKIKSVVSALHGENFENLNPRELAKAITEGVELAGYQFTKYKKGKEVSIEQFDIVVSNGRSATQAKKGVELGLLFAKGTNFARDLVNTPAQDMAPKHMVEAAQVISQNASSLKLRIFDKDRLEKMGAGGILGVAKGSEHAPYLVHFVYTPKQPTKKSVAFVGKGVTFDSGGLSLKPAQYMTDMKCDMAGAAAVLGLFSVIADLAPKIIVHGIFAVVENMPAGNAVRPGDVLTMMNKKTVEVLNTDAEGRLILADSLVYAEKQKPDSIIDLATLTGACVVALGEEYTGVMSNNSTLANKILVAAATAGEKMWELPLEKNYKKLIKSNIADIKNVGGRYGGTLTAGLFLEEFIKDVPWAHLDIAGPAFAERDVNSYNCKGATGHGVRTLIEFLR
jgi:leucyl aminopeptidase